VSGVVPRGDIAVDASDVRPTRYLVTVTQLQSAVPVLEKRHRQSLYRMPAAAVPFEATLLKRPRSSPARSARGRRRPPPSRVRTLRLALTTAESDLLRNA